jgi:uncharacterized protein (DUF3820 family)
MQLADLANSKILRSPEKYIKWYNHKDFISGLIIMSYLCFTNHKISSILVAITKPSKLNTLPNNHRRDDFA